MSPLGVGRAHGASTSRRAVSATSSHDYEVVIVTYNSCEQLAGLLASARRNQRIAVVDNSSGADGTQECITRFSKARWLDGGGQGFTKAANLGARTSTAEYLVFVNPDCRPAPEQWDSLVDDLRADPQLALVGAGAIDASGRLELGVGGWEPTLRRTFVYAVGLHRLFHEAGVYARPQRDQTVHLDWLGAPCLAIRRDLFLRLGGFDERYFVYNDDMAFGRTVRLAGLNQRLRTDLHVEHNAGTSGGGGTAMFQQRGASMADYLHHHNRVFAALAMRAMLVAGAAARAAIALAGGQRPHARRQGAYIAGLITKRSPYRSVDRTAIS